MAGDARSSNPVRQKPEFLVPLFSPRQRTVYLAGIAIWLGALAYFWVWWVNPLHIIGIGRFTILSLVLVWITLLPLYFLAFFIFAKTPSRKVHIDPSSRVAMVVTKAPSESFSIVAETLEAMLIQDFPHDTWLADEDPSVETLAWCRDRGIQVSTRKGRQDYHRDKWPRRTRCKEGNLAFFYDHHGYQNYDFVAQLDADHVPSPTYLREILAPFANPEVGYVSAPSICDKNAASSWSARGRLYVEGMLHGALQAGYNSGWAPLCIGSHYAVRTAALKEIGGLGPELAEDHSTTLLMNAHGWRGVHAIDAIAHGDGPQTFADLATQEFQWSRSLVTILLQYSPTYVARLPLRLKFQFLFSQSWYPLFAFFMLCMFLMPIIALATGRTFAEVTFWDFLFHYAPLAALLLGLVAMFSSHGWARPRDAKALSWEGTLFLFARWPWALAGTLAALRDFVSGVFVDYQVTPKGGSTSKMLPFRVIAPYVVLAIASAIPVLVFDDVQSAAGFYLFAIFNAVIYALLLVVILVRHVIENRIGWHANARPFALQASLACAVMALPSVALWSRGIEGLHGLEQGAGQLKLTRVTYPVSGAGQGGPEVRYYRFSPHWELEAAD